ncbi:hypothetical protein [Pantoea phytobeneficialis]|uniref:Lipoprotein n=1 Tax=Pantoea phytobeneficialis TaxID=2052056 RepID=A0AAP9KS78_9GAMM|nr:hypothetical protein [Pantoea phytobeneficialis]MDO6406470.1 hypothetical protein [Pantoea phytobeneficialis]QGR09567.1 hypothetical protein CTZ24_24170 [Pantoea phytobeneficialis]
MKKLLSSAVIVFMAVGLSGCAISLPFNNRLAYSSITDMKSVQIQGEKPRLSITWNPADFPQRIDIQGSDGFVGGGSRTRVPTGVALSSRIEEAISTYADLVPNGKDLTITILEAHSGFEYSAGMFNITPAIDVGKVTLNASFNLNGKTWTQQFSSYKKDPTIGGTSATGILESAWDDVAVQVAKSVASHINN